MISFLYLVAGICLASTLGNVPPADQDDIVSSLSLPPGFNIRRVKSVPAQKLPHPQKVQRMKMTRLPRPRHQSTGRPSAAALFSAMQQDDPNPSRFGNISVVDRYADQYSVEVLFNGTPMQVIIDSGSSDTWVRGVNFTCSTRNNISANCNLGPPYPEPDFQHGRIPDLHFAIVYGDDERMAGQLGYMDVEVAGITVSNQEVGMASQGTWYGNNVTSGVMGMAYPALTSAYMTDNLTDNSDALAMPYSPLFTSMVTAGLIQPYWEIAIDRNSTRGTFALGGDTPVNINGSHYAESDMLITDLAHRGPGGYQLSFYTIVPTGFLIGGTSRSSALYPFILDTGTTLTYLPPDIAQHVNSLFNPPAQFLWYYNAFFVPCNAIPPRFAVLIGNDQAFYFNPVDMVNHETKDPLTGLCQTGVASGGNGPFVLGLSFLTNVLVRFNVGDAQVGFWSREFY